MYTYSGSATHELIFAFAHTALQLLSSDSHVSVWSYVRSHNTGKNLDTGISVFLIYETGIPVLIPCLSITWVYCATIPGKVVCWSLRLILVISMS
jgi:hypothetical protein